MAADTQAAATFNLIDEQGVKGTLHMPCFIDSAQTVAQVKTALLAQAVLLDGVTGAKILRSELSVLQPSRAGLKADAAEGSRIQETGNFDFDNAVTRYVYDSIVPAIDDTVLTGPPNRIDETNAAVIAYLAALGGAFLGGTFTDRSYISLRNEVRNFLSDRKRRRALNAVSRQVP